MDWIIVRIRDGKVYQQEVTAGVCQFHDGWVRFFDPAWDPGVHTFEANHLILAPGTYEEVRQAHVRQAHVHGDSQDCRRDEEEEYSGPRGAQDGETNEEQL